MRLVRDAVFEYYLKAFDRLEEHLVEKIAKQIVNQMDLRGNNINTDYKVTLKLCNSHIITQSLKRAISNISPNLPNQVDPQRNEENIKHIVSTSQFSKMFYNKLDARFHSIIMRLVEEKINSAHQ